MSTKINKISFKGQVLFIGMDVHLATWHITILTKDLFLKHFSQEADTARLINYLREKYPGAAYKCVYEAGYSGFWLADRLNNEGIECMVVNAADIPITNKQQNKKTDRTDSKKLAELLRSGLLCGIYIPKSEDLEDRSLLRTRAMLVRQQASMKNRIKAFLSFYGISISDEQAGKHWSKRYMSYLKAIRLSKQSGQQSLESLLRAVDFSREQILEMTKKIRELSQTDKYSNRVNRLITIPGIGVISAMVILTEVMDIKRFSSVNRFRGYIGIIPKEHSSGNKENKSEITRRSNKQLKTTLVESSWTAVRTEPSMTLAFELLTSRMKKSRAIIRIARKISNRVLHILNTGEEYVFGVA
jgi:transposase